MIEFFDNLWMFTVAIVVIVKAGICLDMICSHLWHVRKQRDS